MNLIISNYKLVLEKDILVGSSNNQRLYSINLLRFYKHVSKGKTLQYCLQLACTTVVLLIKHFGKVT